MPSLTVSVCWQHCMTCARSSTGRRVLSGGMLVAGYWHGASTALRRHQSRRSSPTKLWTTSWMTARLGMCHAMSGVPSPHDSGGAARSRQIRRCHHGRGDGLGDLLGAQHGIGNLGRKMRRSSSRAKKAMAWCRTTPARVRVIRRSFALFPLSCGSAVGQSGGRHGRPASAQELCPPSRQLSWDEGPRRLGTLCMRSG